MIRYVIPDFYTNKRNVYQMNTTADEYHELLGFYVYCEYYKYELCH